jgi:molybdate transport system substrate-binding protein
MSVWLFSTCTVISAGFLLFACNPESTQSTGEPSAMSSTVPAEIYVASGAGYRKPVDELKSIFESRTRIRVNCIYGNMRQVTTQVKTSGKVSVVIGDARFLNKSGIGFKKKIPMGTGKLILAVARNVSLENVNELAQSGTGRIVVPDAKKAIYGRAAAEVLKRLNIFDQVKARLVTVQTVPQVVSYLSSGTARIGFMNRTDFSSLDPHQFSAIEIDPSLYDPIIIEAALTRQVSAAAARYWEFIRSDEGHSVFERHGLGLQ